MTTLVNPISTRMARADRAAARPANPRRRFVACLLACGVAPALGADKRGMPLVGVLAATGLSSLDYLRQGLAGLGYVEGQDVAFAFRSADGNPGDLPGLARHLARLNVDVMFCAGPAAVDAAVHATSEVPIVALDLETDPVRSGLVRSLQQPRTNVTGLFIDQPALAARWLALLREVVPQAQQLNLLWDASSGPWQLAAAKAAAHQAGYEIDTLVVRKEADFERELADGMRSKPDALLLLSSPLVRARSKQLAAFSLAQRLPTLSAFSEFPRAGGLMSYGPDVQDFYRRTSAFVDKILKGARAGDLPILQPSRFELVINERTATTLGLALPQALRAAASEVIP
jgi:putative tryptophan/tyrosine transport system substrate-binding protein